MIRLIARIDSRNGFHIKTINCEGVRKLRYISESIKDFSSGINQHDELIIIDNVASLYGFDNWLLKESQEHLYVPIPITIGGGIDSVETAKKTLIAGADKILINTAAIIKPALVEEISESVGRQAVVLQIDTRKLEGQYYCFTNGAREKSKYSLVNWIKEAQSLGVGEIHITSIDNEGIDKEIPLDLAAICREYTKLPIIFSGGIRSAEIISKLYKDFYIDSFSFSSWTNIIGLSVNQIREILLSYGHEVRIVK